MASPPPAAHLPLTAAEALILLEPTKAQGKAALKLTLLELLAQRLLTVYRQERRGFLGRRRNIDLLQCTPEATQRVPPRAHVRAVLRALSTAGGSRGIPMKRVVTAMRKAFGADLAGYQTRYLVPELVERGLLEVSKSQIFWIFWRTYYHRTLGGDAARRQLEEQLAQARALPALLDSDPAQVAALVVTLGSTVLLAEELRAHYTRLSQAMRESSGDILSSFDLADLSAVDSGWEAFDTGFGMAEWGDGGNGGNSGNGGNGGNGGGE